MNQLDKACQEICSKVEDAMAVGIIDLGSGMIMGLDNKSGLKQNYLDKMSSAVLNLFRGNEVKKIENKKDENSFKEILINNNNNLVFIKQVDNLNYVIFIVSGKELNQGIGWSTLKISIQDIKPLLA